MIGSHSAQSGLLVGIISRTFSRKKTLFELFTLLVDCPRGKAMVLAYRVINLAILDLLVVSQINV